MPAVPSDHRFDDPAYVRDWAEGINERRPARLVVFAQIADELRRRVTPVREVLEVGSGPGMLAEHLLAAVPAIERYVLLDYSAPMHDLARQRLASHASRSEHVVASFLEPGWVDALAPAFDAVVSMQAVHELRDATLIPGLYAQLEQRLRPGGLLVVGDMINRPGDHQDHRLTPEEHVDAMLAAGFASAEILAVHDDLALVRADRGGVPPEPTA